MVRASWEVGTLTAGLGLGSGWPAAPPEGNSCSSSFMSTRFSSRLRWPRSPSLAPFSARTPGSLWPRGP